jgi:cytochrome c oxidase cbb3-type subunit 4
MDTLDINLIDINTLRSIVTVLAFLAFVGIVIWVWQPRRKSAFHEAALLPFTAEAQPPASRTARPDPTEARP